MGTRTFALIFGIFYLLVGILGFIPGFLTPEAEAHGVTVDTLYGRLFGIFPVNILHSIVHALIGLWGIIAYRSFGASRGYARAVAVIFLVLTIMGLIPGLDVTFGLIPLYGNDIWLHALTAIIAGYFGFVRAPSEAVV